MGSSDDVLGALLTLRHQPPHHGDDGLPHRKNSPLDAEEESSKLSPMAANSSSPDTSTRSSVTSGTEGEGRTVGPPGAHKHAGALDPTPSQLFQHNRRGYYCHGGYTPHLTRRNQNSSFSYPPPPRSHPMPHCYIPYYSFPVYRYHGQPVYRPHHHPTEISSLSSSNPESDRTQNESQLSDETSVHDVKLKNGLRIEHRKNESSSLSSNKPNIFPKYHRHYGPPSNYIHRSYGPHYVRTYQHPVYSHSQPHAHISKGSGYPRFHDSIIYTYPPPNPDASKSPHANKIVEVGLTDRTVPCEDVRSKVGQQDVLSRTPLETNTDTQIGEESSDPFGNNPDKTRRASAGKWTPREDETLRSAVTSNSGKNWKRIAIHLPGRTDVQCLHRWQKVLKPGLVKGPWTPEEDAKVVELVKTHGQKKWSFIARQLHGRLGKQCRERWYNHLSPDIKKGEWTEEEDELIIKCHAKWGNKWAEISKSIEGRTDNAIKNRWNSTLKRRVSESTEHKDDDNREIKNGKKRKSSSLHENDGMLKRSARRNILQVDESDVDAVSQAAVALSGLASSAKFQAPTVSSPLSSSDDKSKSFVSPSPKVITSIDAYELDPTVPKPIPLQSFYECSGEANSLTRPFPVGEIETVPPSLQSASLSDASLLMDLNKSKTDER